MAGPATANRATSSLILIGPEVPWSKSPDRALPRLRCFRSIATLTMAVLVQSATCMHHDAHREATCSSPPALLPAASVRSLPNAFTSFRLGPAKGLCPATVQGRGSPGSGVEQYTVSVGGPNEVHQDAGPSALVGLD